MDRKNTLDRNEGIERLAIKLERSTKIKEKLAFILESNELSVDDFYRDDDSFVQPNPENNCSNINIFEVTKDRTDEDDRSIQNNVLQDVEEETKKWKLCAKTFLQKIDSLIESNKAQTDELRKFQLKTALEDFEYEKKETERARDVKQRLKQKLKLLHDSLANVDSSQLLLNNDEKLRWLSERKKEILKPIEKPGQFRSSYDTVE